MNRIDESSYRVSEQSSLTRRKEEDHRDIEKGMNIFPLEIVNHILEYAGRVKYRNGKYMNQILSDDGRYNMLKRIAKIIPYKYDFWYMTIIMNKHKIRIEKYKYLYSNDEPEISIQTSETSRYYRFAQYGISYRWIIQK